MHRPRSFALVAASAVLGFLSAACLEQYDPSRYKAQEKREYQQARVGQPKLTETGEIPAPGEVKAVAVDVQYKNLCAGCHGNSGGGDGPAGVALNPKPRNLTDAAWQSQASDEHIAKVIKDGGASVGLSAMMAPWGSVMNDEQIHEMVVFIRAMKKG